MIPLGFSLSKQSLAGGIVRQSEHMEIGDCQRNRDFHQVGIAQYSEADVVHREQPYLVFHLAAHVSVSKSKKFPLGLARSTS